MKDAVEVDADLLEVGEVEVDVDVLEVDGPGKSRTYFVDAGGPVVGTAGNAMDRPASLERTEIVTVVVDSVDIVAVGVAGGFEDVRVPLSVLAAFDVDDA